LQGGTKQRIVDEKGDDISSIQNVHSPLADLSMLSKIQVQSKLDESSSGVRQRKSTRGFFSKAMRPTSPSHEKEYVKELLLRNREAFNHATESGKIP
jgi:hypothetical protein